MEGGLSFEGSLGWVALLPNKLQCVIGVVSSSMICEEQSNSCVPKAAIMTEVCGDCTDDAVHAAGAFGALAAHTARRRVQLCHGYVGGLHQPGAPQIILPVTGRPAATHASAPYNILQQVSD